MSIKAIKEGEKLKDALLSMQAFDAASTVRDLLKIARKELVQRELSECTHEVTISSYVRHEFGDILPFEAFCCFSCKGWFIKNNDAVEPFYSETAQDWVSDYLKERAAQRGAIR